MSKEVKLLRHNEEAYKRLINKLKETFLKKNHDYGSSVKKNYDKFEAYGKNEGLKYVFGRIAEKHDRLENLIYGAHTNQVTDESVEDTLLDMANYAILAAVSIQEHKTNSVQEHKANPQSPSLAELIKKYYPDDFKQITLKPDSPYGI